MPRTKKDTEGSVPLYLFHRGANRRAYEYLGLHKEACPDGTEGMVYRVWAPHAQAVSLVGDFNNWDPTAAVLQKISGGIWEGRLPLLLPRFSLYKFAVTGADGKTRQKADPYARSFQNGSEPAAIYTETDDFVWQDDAWQRRRSRSPHAAQPVNIYELHTASWKQNPDGSPYTYRQLTEELIPYVKDMGYTHIELLPLAETMPGDAWGYRAFGLFAPTARHGAPADFMAFVDACHRAEIGVLLDWSPAHFPQEPDMLALFDGSPCYESFRRGEPVFDYTRPEVISFLLSSAVFWVKEYHIDGLRVDSVASMVYTESVYEGAPESLEAIRFLQKLNEAVFAEDPHVLMIAEESAARPMVTKPPYLGGLGFNYKWNTGWINDMLQYMELDPIHRKYRHEALTFSLFYAFSENFILPLTHDDVAQGKRSLLEKMPGTLKEKMAAVRLFIGYMMAYPGKKLLFMGSEFGQRGDWNSEQSLEWDRLQQEDHCRLQAFFRGINHFYKETPALWENDFSWNGFEWISNDDADQSVIAFRRKGEEGGEVLVVCNFLPVERKEYRIGVPWAGIYTELFSSDAVEFGGSGTANGDTIKSEAVPLHNCGQSISLTLPASSVVFLKCRRKYPPRRTAPKPGK